MREPKQPVRRSRKSGPFVGNPAWHDFVRWCEAHNLKPVPANAWTLAAYIRSFEGRMSLKKLKKHVDDIAKAHAEKSRRRPERDPLIARTFRIMEQRSRTRDDQSALFEAETLPGDTPGSRPSPPKAPTSGTKPGKDKPATRARVMTSQPRLVRRRTLK